MEENFCHLVDTEAPMGIIQIQTKYRSWLSDETKKVMSEQDAARLTARETDNQSDWDVYRQMRNLCTSKQRRDKANYLKEKFDQIEAESDSSKLYSTVRQLLNLKQAGPPSCLRKDGKDYVKQKDIAEIQASYYSVKIHRIKNNIPKVNLNPLRALKRVFRRWDPASRKPRFSLSLSVMFSR